MSFIVHSAQKNILIKLHIQVPLAKSEKSLDKHNGSEQNIDYQIYFHECETLGLGGQWSLAP
jgi:hypothetical protein